MKLQIAIVEDSTEAREYLNSLISELFISPEIKFDIKTFSSAEEFIFENENNNIYDILLLDVEMGEISGIDLAKRVRAYDKRAEIIFITSHFELIGEGYEVDARHFLIKPISKEKLKEVLSRAVSHLSKEPPTVMIKCDGESIKLMTSQILYIESFLHYIVVHTEGGDYKIKESLAVFGEKLGKEFFKIHRSYLVALNRIVRISRTEVTLENGLKLPLSRGSYDAVNRAFIEQN